MSHLECGCYWPALCPQFASYSLINFIGSTTSSSKMLIYLGFPIYEKSAIVGTRKVKGTNIGLILMVLTLCLYLRHPYTEQKGSRILEILECERAVNFQKLFRHDLRLFQNISKVISNDSYICIYTYIQYLLLELY